MKLKTTCLLLCAVALEACYGSGGDSNSSADMGAGGSSGASGASGESAKGGSSGAGGSTLGGAAGNGGSGTTGGSAGTASAGSGGAGGTSAETGDPPFFPTTVTSSDADAAYQAWKTAHLEDCGSGVYRVRWENDKQDATVSEGIGYGMLLAVAHDEQGIFDGLLAYAKSMRAEFTTVDETNPDNGLMNWLRYGCDAHRDFIYGDYPDNAAADADLDVAMALLMADCRWGDASYGTEASVVITAIKNDMFVQSGGLWVLQPGDSSWFDDLGTGCVNYSYFAPAYYRAFAEHMPSDATFWNKAADDVYTLLAAASNASTGLVRNWGSVGGGDATTDCRDAYNRASSYGDDAARTPWRIATDYLWNGTPEAKAWTDKTTLWVKSVGIQELVQWYNLDGTPDTLAGTWDDHTAINIGPFAVGAMTYGQTTADEFASELISIPTTAGSHDAEYFPRMLKALSLLSLTGQFSACGGL